MSRAFDEMTRVWHSDPIDLTEWDFFGDENPWRDLLVTGFAVHVNKILRQEFQDRPPKLFFPFSFRDGDGFGGKCPDDFATVYVSLPLGATSDECVCWSISLEAAVDDMLQTSNPDAPFDKIAARLRELADKLQWGINRYQQKVENVSTHSTSAGQT